MPISHALQNAATAMRQFWLGNKLWRERERDPQSALLGLGWLSRAARSGNAAANQMLVEHTEAVAEPMSGPFAAFSERGIEQLQRAEPLLAARIALGKAFDLTRLEALLIDPLLAYHDQFLVVDLSHATPRHKRRILRITSNQQRLWLAHAVMKFRNLASGHAPVEGDYRSRLYRCEKALLQEQERAAQAVANTQKNNVIWGACNAAINKVPRTAPIHYSGAAQGSKVRASG